jgi:hypothetical protein
MLWPGKLTWLPLPHPPLTNGRRLLVRCPPRVLPLWAVIPSGVRRFFFSVRAFRERRRTQSRNLSSIHRLAEFASCGVRELAPAVCRSGSPGRAPRTEPKAPPRQATVLGFVGARYIVPGKLTWLPLHHPPRTNGRRLLVRYPSRALHYAPSFRAECPAVFLLREAPGPDRAPGSTVSRAREISRGISLRCNARPAFERATNQCVIP